MKGSRGLAPGQQGRGGGGWEDSHSWPVISTSSSCGDTLQLLCPVLQSHQRAVMPGHVKRGGTGEPDPDPTPYLFVTYEEKQKDLAKPYDPKKSCWFPRKEGGFGEGIIEATEGDKVVVKAGGEKVLLKKDQVQQVNPPKFERCEDMSNLTYLNEASVLHNLKARYVSKLIYTYSGLFCVAINPYKRFPIYTATAVKIYFGKRRNEVPPHIFAIADGAYQSMINHGKNQSILVTGESGAGKTENTKKVIGYFAEIAAGSDKVKADKVSLEDQIVQTNPVLEAFGNAKTVRNDNSSRFGKFIRIHFNQFGKVSGADMEVYLLEKSRITFQQSLERCYHIFYNIMSDAVASIKKDCCLTNNIKDYHFVSQGKITVDSIDDKEDMSFVDDAFNILGFTKAEKTNVYKLTACVMHLGEMKFKKKSSKDDQAEADEEKSAKNISQLLGIEADLLYENFVRPKIKVGAEWVTKGQNVSQATNSGKKTIYHHHLQFLQRTIPMTSCLMNYTFKCRRSPVLCLRSCSATWWTDATKHSSTPR